MAANTCPACGQAVMTYGRFLREAEPTRISPCGSCGAPLRRSPRVFILLLAMALLLVLAVAVLGQALLMERLSGWVAALLGVLVLAVWTLVTNYLGFRLVGWVPADRDR